MRLRAALPLAALAACSRVATAPPSPTPSASGVAPAASEGAASVVAPAALPAVRALRVASGPRWLENGDVVFLDEPRQGTLELLAYAPERGLRLLLSTTDKALIQLVMDAQRQGQFPELVDAAISAAGAKPGGAVAGEPESAGPARPIKPRGPHAGPQLAVSVAGVTLIEGGQTIASLEGHRDWGSTGGVKPTGTLRSDGSRAALGTESEIALVTLADRRAVFLRSSQHRELFHLSLFSTSIRGGWSSLPFRMVDSLAWRPGALVWGLVALGGQRVASLPWPHSQRRFVTSGAGGAMVLAPEDYANPRPRAPAQLLVPDPQRPQSIALPDTPHVTRLFADDPLRTQTEYDLAVDAGHTRVGWVARSAGATRVFRTRSLADGATREATLPGSAVPLMNRNTSEMPVGAPSTPVFRPGRHELLALPGDSFVHELSLINMESGQVRRFPEVVGLDALAPSGEWAVAQVAGNGRVQQTALLNLDSGRVAALPACPSVVRGSQGAVFSPDSTEFYDFSCGGGVSLRRCTASDPARCSPTAYAGARIHSMAVSPTALFVLDVDMRLVVFDRATGTEAGELFLGDTWAAARFLDGKVELWGDEAKAGEALWCQGGEGQWAPWASCAGEVRVSGRLAKWL